MAKKPPMTAAVKKKKIVDVLPAKFRKAFKKAILKKLTFGDLNLVESQLNKAFQDEQGDYKINSCGACCQWP